MSLNVNKPPKPIGGFRSICGYGLVYALLSAFLAVTAHASTGGKDILSADERVWLTSNQSRLVLAVETGYAPFVFLDSKGQPGGLAHDYLLLIESKLGVHFNQRRFPSLDDIFQKVRNGEVHIVNAVTNTPSRSKFLSMTESFISVPNVIIVRKDRSGRMSEHELSGLTVSLVKTYAITEHMTIRGLGFVSDIVADDLTALLNVSFGRSDAAIIDLATATYLISEKGITNLRVAGEAPFDIRLSIGTPLDEPVLHSILQKGLNAIADTEREKIEKRWINTSNRSIFNDRQFWVVLGSVLSAALVILAVILIWNRALRRQVAIRTEALVKEKESSRESEARLSAIFESVADAIITIDAHGHIQSFNPAAEKLFGYSPDEVRSQNVRLLLPESYRAEHDAYLHNYRSTGKRKIIDIGREVKGLHRDGSTFPMDLAVSEVEINGERRFTGIVRDITERKRAEQTLLAAKDAAELASRAKDAFLATMSHEIRTPLGGLLGMLELLSLSPLDPEQAETLQTARDSGRSLLRILNDILDWSKIEEGKLELTLQPTSIAQLMAEVANTYAHVAGANSVTLSSQVDARLSPALVVDPLRLSQVLNNFVSNAIKFSHGGQVELRADLVLRHEGTEQLRFSVRDTGIGIAPEAQRRLFQSYGQASADTARMYGGTGLGLAICRRLADLLDGRIELDSAPGHGSTFSITLTLPIAETVVDEWQSPPERVAAASVQPLVPGIAAANAPLVLVVDDHPVNRKLLARQLGLLGWRAETAENGEAALAQWRAGRHAMVITDCHMPVMDGYALTRSIREIEVAEARPRTPIFAWTANALADEIENCKAAGMDELLVKPVDLGQLTQMLTRWLPAGFAGGAETPAAVPPAPTFAVKHDPPSRGMGCGEGAQGVASSAPLDVSVLAALVGDDPATIREFLLDFRASAPAIAAELSAACAAGQAAQAGSLAHKLKSSARSIGALALGDLCAELEATAKATGNDALGALHARFMVQMAAVDTALSAFTANNNDKGENP